MLKKFRINEVDVAKGIGIFLIVFGHTIINGDAKTFVFSFHVPLFFMLSGLVFVADHNWKRFLKKKFMRLYLPYLLVSLISLFIFVVASQIIGDKFDGFNINASIPECLLGIVYGNSKVFGLLKWNQPLWFIPCMFFVLIIANMLASIYNKLSSLKLPIIIWKILAIVIFLFLGYIFTKIDIALPFSAEVGFYMLAFFEIGNVCSNLYYNNRDSIKSKTIILILLSIILFAIVWFISTFNSFAQVRTMILGKSYLLYTLCSILGSLAVFCISIVIRNLSFMQKLGHASLFIMLWHKFPILFFQGLCPYTKIYLKQGETLIGNLTAVIVSILTIIMVYILYIIWTKIKKTIKSKRR